MSDGRKDAPAAILVALGGNFDGAGGNGHAVAPVQEGMPGNVGTGVILTKRQKMS